MKFSFVEDVWYCNLLLGKYKLENFFFEMFKKVGLVIIYILYCLWVIFVIILKVFGFENVRVKLVIGYKSDLVVESYYKCFIFE